MPARSASCAAPAPTPWSCAPTRPGAPRRSSRSALPASTCRSSGPRGFDGTFWLKGIPSTKDIYATINGSAYDPPNEETAKLFKSLERAGVDTDVSGTLLGAYAGGQMILDAIRETGSVDGNTLADALEAKPHDTVVGRLAYTPDNHQPSRTWPIYSYSSGKPKLVAKVKPQFIPEYGESERARSTSRLNACR